MLSSVKRLNLFSTPLLRRSSTTISQWCGLIKLPYIPLDGLNHKLNGKDAVVLIDDVLYYAEQKNKKLLLIKESVANALDYRQLKSKCNDAWQAATADEIQLITRILSPVPPDREDESRSHNASYSSITNSGEVDYAYALANEERRKKEFYRNNLIADMLTDSGRKPDSQRSESKQSSEYSSGSNNHSSHSSDHYDSSNHSSSSDDSSSSYDSPSCGGASSDD